MAPKYGSSSEKDPKSKIYQMKIRDPRSILQKGDVDIFMLALYTFMFHEEYEALDDTREKNT